MLTQLPKSLNTERVPFEVGKFFSKFRELREEKLSNGLQLTQRRQVGR